MDVALARGTALALARAFVVAGADAGPRGEVRGALEDAHVRPQLRDDRGGNDTIDARDGREARVLLAVRCELRVDPLVELRDVLLELLDACELHLEQEAVVLFDATFEREFQLGDLVAHLLLRELGHLLRRRVAAQYRLEHRLAGDAEYVADDARQLDVGSLEQLV